MKLHHVSISGATTRIRVLRRLLLILLAMSLVWFVILPIIPMLTEWARKPLAEATVGDALWLIFYYVCASAVLGRKSENG
jgi:hypothetical protein